MEEPKTPGSELQFDRAEFEQPTVARCTLCHAPIHEAYFEVNGQVACPSCREQVEQPASGGSGLGRFARAALLGTGAAAVGSGLYYAVRAMTGLELSLIAIVVGVLVGIAVKTGAQRRGGWVYQGLAMFLTYMAIVSTQVPTMFKDTEATPAGLPSAIRIVVIVAILLVLPFLVPFVEGFQGLIYLFIVGIGVYEAWKINRRVPVVVNGPFRLATPAAGD
jgi:hypothetical protein